MATGQKRIADSYKWITVKNGMIRVGDSTTGLKMAADVGAPFQLYIQSADTTGTIRIAEFGLTMTGAATANMVEAVKINLTANIKTGAWANALYVNIDYSTSGAAHGMAASLCAEMIPPNSSLARGALYALDLEFGCGASSSWASAGPVAFMKMENWGTATHFSANAFLFHLAGETGAAGALLGANSNTIKVRIGTATEYMVLSEYEDVLSIGLTGAKKTAVTGVPEISVWRTSALTSGTQEMAKLDWTQTANQQTGSLTGLRVNINSEYRIAGANNAVYGCIDLGTTGSIHGMAGALCGEVILPNGSLARGAAYALELELGGGASTSWASAGPVAFIYCGGYGTGLVSDMNTRGYLIDIQGFAEGSNLLVDNDGANPTATGGIRCRVGTTDIWLLYRDSAPA